MNLKTLRGFRVLALLPGDVAETILPTLRLHDPLEALVSAGLLEARELLLGDLLRRQEDVLRRVAGVRPAQRLVLELEDAGIPAALEAGRRRCCAARALPTASTSAAWGIGVGVDVGDDGARSEEPFRGGALVLGGPKMRLSGRPAFRSLTMSSAERSFAMSAAEMYFLRKSSERFAFQSLMRLSTRVGVGVGVGYACAGVPAAVGGSGAGGRIQAAVRGGSSPRRDPPRRSRSNFICVTSGNARRILQEAARSAPRASGSGIGPDRNARLVSFPDGSLAGTVLRGSSRRCVSLPALAARPGRIPGRRASARARTRRSRRFRASTACRSTRRAPSCGGSSSRPSTPRSGSSPACPDLLPRGARYKKGPTAEKGDVLTLEATTLEGPRHLDLHGPRGGSGPSCSRFS